MKAVMEGNVNRPQSELQTLSSAGASVGLYLRWWIPGAEAVGVAIAGFRHRRLGASSRGKSCNRRA